MTFGNKEHFAVEIEKDPTYLFPGYAKVRIWAEGLYLGDFDDVAYLSALFASLEGDMERIKVLPLSCQCMSPEEVFIERFDRQDESDYKEELDSYNMLCTDTFDDFLVLGYQTNDEKMIWVWRLCEDHYSNYPDYPPGILTARLNIASVVDVVHRAKSYLKEIAWLDRIRLNDYEKWADANQNFSLYDYLFGVVKTNQLADDIYIAFLKMFWPDFYCIDGCVFLKEQFEPEYYDRLLNEGTSRQEIEKWINLFFLGGMMQESTSDESIRYLAIHLTKLWEMKLKEDFPDKEFDVKYFHDEEDGYFVVFSQR